MLPLVVGLAGLWPTADEQKWLSHWQPVGVILFARNVSGFSQLQNLCALIHQLVPGCEVMSDHEGGAISQLCSALGRPPAPWSLGRIDDPDLTRAVHQETAERASAAGLDRILGPCTDVLSEMRNPVIGARAFGSAVDLVSRHVTAAVQGLLAGGQKTCLKHWPGHGGSTSDSHLEPAGLMEKYLAAPYLAGLAAGADAIMAGHLAGPDQVPATLNSAKISAGRREFASWAISGFCRWLSDDVTMGALRPAMAQVGVELADGLDTGLIDPKDLTKAWFDVLLAAGCDWLLIRGIPWQAYELPDQPDKTPYIPQVSSDDDGIIVRDTTATYQQIRKMLWPNRAFYSLASRLIWLDFTEDDRWMNAAQHEELKVFIEAQFSDVLRVGASEISTGGYDSTGDCRGDRLLVSGYRPLDIDLILKQLNKIPFSNSGRCLVMGHPSLEGDFRELLGESWQIDALFDITLQDVSVS